ncbi:MAG: lipoprotein signal peptidase [Rhodocyclaceae bacterium]|nr:lipoprotein signal peptidase [Rhodocyclaceae bacterium]MCP5232147.1 lipoprotein signal peptidase [Zoogloeaceae bacterium]MCB1910532.1 lipoprotein signal peptidase [Rhodocyclaceae bacterium]MCP5238517.1 lipoprotein signal peptidase [Zoogloeaceae bacterium]MCP5254569.1 lipoprotein signal peptidase [Zoogloeaceae bacterium]
MTPRLAGWLALATLVAILDQGSKHWVMAVLDFGDSVPVTGFFDLVLVFNPGAAFSFLADHSGWQRWFFIVLAFAICAWLLTLLRHHQDETLLPTAFALIIGGALGNVIDRFVFGAVVDFLYFHVGRYGWPAFNLADSAITLGVILMLTGQLKGQRGASPQEKKS